MDEEIRDFLIGWLFLAAFSIYIVKLFVKKLPLWAYVIIILIGPIILILIGSLYDYAKENRKNKRQRK